MQLSSLSTTRYTEAATLATLASLRATSLVNNASAANDATAVAAVRSSLLSAADASELTVLPLAGVAFVAIYSLCGSQIEDCTLADAEPLVLDVVVLRAICSGDLSTWDDARLVALNPWLGEEPAASVVAAQPLTLLAEATQHVEGAVFVALAHNSRGVCSASVPASVMGTWLLFIIYDGQGAARLSSESGDMPCAWQSTLFRAFQPPGNDVGDDDGAGRAACS